MIMGLLKVDYSEIKPHLVKDEKIFDSLSGNLTNTLPGNEKERTGMLVATDRRLIFLTYKTEGKDVTSFPYTEIRKVEEGAGITGFPLEFVVGGKIYEMLATRRGSVKRMVSIVRSEIEEIRREGHARPVQADVYADINKLGELRDNGLISPEEYEAKKKELLARI
jgi:hypothetical protein